MSLQGLISGSECALPNNPLAQVLKHTDGDRSVQRDRLAGPSSSRLQHLPVTSAGRASEQDLQLARQFFDANRAHQVQSQLDPSQQDILRQSAATHRSLEAHQHASEIDLQHTWNQREGRMNRDFALSSAWANEFGSIAQSSLLQDRSSLQYEQSRSLSPSTTSHSSMPWAMMSDRPFSPNYGQIFAPMQMPDKGKGKAREEAFDSIFAEYASDLQARESRAKIEEVQGSESDLGEMLAQSSTSDEQGSFEAVTEAWSKLQDPAPPEDMARLEAEFQQLMQANKDNVDFDYGASIREAMGDDLGSFAETFPDGMKFDDEGIPQLPPYEFILENKYKESSDTVSCLEQAKHLLQNGGSLSEVALLLEAAIQKGEFGEGGYETWVLLGETRCMDEREEAGMSALLEGIRRAEAAGTNGTGMLTLASAFTNEGYERGSHALLLRWLTARFPEHTAPPETLESLKHSHWVSRDKVRDAFLSVARVHYNAGIVDADVQSGLGVLFYTDGDFARARDCFAAALAVRPKDYLLWNRYGSALSNGDKPEEALGAYREALQLRPTYTRAIYNVGVACLNIGANKEAAEHFLSALSLQDTTAGDKSAQLWFTLRRAFAAMGRNELANKAKPGADVPSFRAEGFDF